MTVGPSEDPQWWNLLRQVVIFSLGVFFLLYAALAEGSDVALLITGLVLIGFVPVESFLSRVR